MASLTDKENRFFLNKTKKFVLEAKKNILIFKGKSWLCFLFDRKKKIISHSTKEISRDNFLLLYLSKPQNKVIQFISHYYPSALVVAGLGENQITSNMRVDSFKKGYEAGEPDIILNNLHVCQI